MGTALAIYEKMDNPIEAAKVMAMPYAIMCGGQTEQQGFVIALTCMMEGLTALEFSRRYHMIGNKPSQRADWMLAEFAINGGGYEIVECSPKRAAITFTWKGKEFPCEWTIEQALASRWPWKDWKDQEKGLKDNWATPEDQENMLWVRLISKSLKRIAAELFAGVYTPEEMQDVVDTPSSKVVSAPPAKTALEVAKNAAKQEPAEEVLDAEFEVKEDTPPWQEPKQDERSALTPSSTGSVTEQQLTTLHRLFEILDISVDDQKVALAKRKRDRIEDLSKNEADDMISRLEAVKAQRGKP